MITLKITDSGAGFDYQAVQEKLKAGQGNQYSGRGIKLISSLCERVEYSDGGRTAYCEFTYD